jgi:hypothetical protein
MIYTLTPPRVVSTPCSWMIYFLDLLLLLLSLYLIYRFFTEMGHNYLPLLVRWCQNITILTLSRCVTVYRRCVCLKRIKMLDIYKPKACGPMLLWTHTHARRKTTLIDLNASQRSNSAAGQYIDWVLLSTHISGLQPMEADQSVCVQGSSRHQSNKLSSDRSCSCEYLIDISTCVGSYSSRSTNSIIIIHITIYFHNLLF